MTEKRTPAGSIVGSCTETLSIGKETYGVDVGLVAPECHGALSSSDIPHLGETVAGA